MQDLVQDPMTGNLVRHNKGCNCKKSGCLKKYCECFQANILCSDMCKCVDCKNFEVRSIRETVAVMYGLLQPRVEILMLHAASSR